MGTVLANRPYITYERIGKWKGEMNTTDDMMYR